MYRQGTDYQHSYCAQQILSEATGSVLGGGRNPQNIKCIKVGPANTVRQLRKSTALRKKTSFY